MRILSLTTGALAENTYLVTADGSAAVAVDPGGDGRIVQKALSDNGLRCTHVLLTHAHFDHCGGAAVLQKQGAKIYLHRLDAPLLTNGGNLAESCGETLSPFRPDFLLEGGERLALSGLNFSVLHTPGHTAGGSCYLSDDAIFSGDTLFYLSVGRTDFPSGDAAQLRASVREVLYALPGDYRIFPGHDRPTTLAFERENNPYA